MNSTPHKNRVKSYLLDPQNYICQSLEQIPPSATAARPELVGRRFETIGVTL